MVTFDVGVGVAGVGVAGVDVVAGAGVGDGQDGVACDFGDGAGEHLAHFQEENSQAQLVAVESGEHFGKGAHW